MSDNIDYAELDKAVNEAIQNRSANLKNTTRTVTKTASVPRSRGQFMDFVRTQPLPTPKVSVVKPAPKTATPAPATRTNAAPSRVATRPVAKPAPKPVIKQVAQTRKSVASQIQQRQQRINSSAQNATVRPVVKQATKPQVQAVTHAHNQNTSSIKKPADTPNANNYSLGVRSPFMTNTKVEKRPLGTDIPESSTSGIHSTRNVYSSKTPTKTTASKKKHIVTEAPKKHSGWIWTLIVLLVIAAGAGLGYLAYKLVFANQF